MEYEDFAANIVCALPEPSPVKSFETSDGHIFPTEMMVDIYHCAVAAYAFSLDVEVTHPNALNFGDAFAKVLHQYNDKTRNFF